MIARLAYVAKAIVGGLLAALAFLAAPGVVEPLAAVVAQAAGFPALAPLLAAALPALAVAAGVYAVPNGPRP